MSCIAEKHKTRPDPITIILLGVVVCCLLAGTGVAQPVAFAVRPYRLSPEYAVGDRFMGIRLLGTLQLAPGSVDGHRIFGLSGLAWDADERRLYALSDGGRVFHLAPEFEGDRLVGLRALTAFALRDADARPLRGRRADAEGLLVRKARNGIAGDSVLTVSFEHYPRIVDYTPEGRYLVGHRLPARLRDRHGYETPNRALESLAWLPGLGLLTAPERPMHDGTAGSVRIHVLAGGNWRYPLYPLPSGALVAMEALDDGSLLTLERGFGALFLSASLALRRTPVLADPRGGALEVRTIAVLDSTRGWSIDNFEGLTRHEDMKFFMVSDDNNRVIQRTLLTYFEVLEHWVPSDEPEHEPRQESHR